MMATIYQLVNMFLISLMVTTTQCSHCVPDEEAILASKYTSLPSCSPEHVSSALNSNSKCRLHTTVVKLPWPNSTLVQQMAPTHVTVHQCGGYCHGVGQACHALSTRRKEIPVMVGKCGVSVGKCEKECAVVTVEEHTKCGCGCQMDRKECESKGLHRFQEEMCACECKDLAAKRICLEQGSTWSETSCTCGCQGSSRCPPGWEWQEDACICVALLMDQEQEVKEADKQESVLAWELIIITSLLALLGVLIIIVVVLAIRLRLAVQMEKQTGRVLLVPSTLSGHYVAGADPCSDLTKGRGNRSGHPSLSDSGNVSPRQDQHTDRQTDQLTDSSLCSSEQEKEISSGSCESLPTVRHGPGSQPCLQSVGLSRHLAIRPGTEGGSLRLNKPPRHIQPYPGPTDRLLQPLPCPNTYYNTPVPESPYNTVKIVYKKGEKMMELSCQVDQEQHPKGVQITENPYAYEM